MLSVILTTNIFPDDMALIRGMLILGWCKVCRDKTCSQITMYLDRIMMKELRNTETSERNELIQREENDQ